MAFNDKRSGVEETVSPHPNLLPAGEGDKNILGISTSFE
jgi:hypothetical protein